MQQQRYVIRDAIYFSSRLISEREGVYDVTTTSWKVNALLSSNCESLAGKQMPIDPYSVMRTLPGWTTLVPTDISELQFNNCFD